MSKIETTVKDVFATGLRAALRRRGFRDQDLSRAVKVNTLPSGWFPFVGEECQHLGIETPLHLFKWSEDPASKVAQQDAAA